MDDIRKAAGNVFPQVLLDAFGRNPELPAFEHASRSVSRAELLGTIRRLARGLTEAGVRAGHGIALHLSVTPDAYATYLAAFTLGCRVVGVVPGYTPRQRAHVFAAGIDFVVTDPASAAELNRAEIDVPLLTVGSLPGVVDLLAAEAGVDEPLTAEGRLDDVARLVYTSGSTGLPKGCAQTYRALGARWRWRPDGWTPELAGLVDGCQRYLLSGTLASAVIMDYVTRCLLAGGTAVIPDDDLETLFPHAIDRHRITSAIMTVPRLHTMLNVLRREQVDTSSLQALTISGSPISPALYAEALKVLGPVVYKDYGQTEIGMISVLGPIGLDDTAMASVGRPHPDVEISIRSAEGTAVKAGQVGELFVRSPFMMSGYWRDAEQTAEVLVDGWLRTRDLGRLDEHGVLHLVGRTRDVIIVNAGICYAEPIENVLSGHPGVEQAYVVGAPDERTGEAIHAFVVPATAEDPDHAELAELVRAELGANSVPVTFTVVHEVPVTANGKPDKPALLAMRP